MFGGHRHSGGGDIMIFVHCGSGQSCDFMGRSPLRWATILQVWWPYPVWYNDLYQAGITSYNDFSLSSDLARPHGQRIIWFYGWNSVMVSHHPAKSDGHSRCGSGNIMFSVAEEKHPRCSRFNPPLLFISKGHDFKTHDMY